MVTVLFTQPERFDDYIESFPAAAPDLPNIVSTPIPDERGPDIEGFSVDDEASAPTILSTPVGEDPTEGMYRPNENLLMPLGGRSWR